MHGAGNDYVYVNCFSEKLPIAPEPLARFLADRHFGVGGDGMVLVIPSEQADAGMRMFNADGSESEMCGNAIRCVGKLLYDNGISRKNSMRIETGKGVLTVDRLADDMYRVDMGEPVFEPANIPTTLQATRDGRVIEAPLAVAGRNVAVTCLSMGNPHAVVFVDQLSDVWVFEVGPKMEVAPEFPNRVNAEFAEVLSPSSIRMRVWERGTGETFACGTGACATLVAGVLTGRTGRRAELLLRGGVLDIEWREEDNHVFMTGNAVEVFRGDMDIPDDLAPGILEISGGDSNALV